MPSSTDLGSAVGFEAEDRRCFRHAGLDIDRLAENLAWLAERTAG